MSPISPATMTKARDAGILLQEDGRHVVAYFEGKEIARGTAAKTVCEQALRVAPKPKKDSTMTKSKGRAAAEEQQDDEETGEEAEEGAEATGEAEEGDDEGTGLARTIKKYRHKYDLFDSSCGDKVADLLKGFVTVPNSEGKGSIISVDHLKQVAAENGIVYKWEHLNPGQQRMNLGNVLRGKWRKGEGVTVNGKHHPTEYTPEELALKEAEQRKIAALTEARDAKRNEAKSAREKAAEAKTAEKAKAKEEAEKTKSAKANEREAKKLEAAEKAEATKKEKAAAKEKADAAKAADKAKSDAAAAKAKAAEEKEAAKAKAAEEKAAKKGKK